MAKNLIIGKIYEYQIISGLLREGFEVFLPTVDDRGVDCVIRNKNGKFIEIQIKSRREGAQNIFNIKPFTPKENYFFALVPPDQKTYIIPSFKIKEWLNGKSKFHLSKKLRTEYEGKYSLLNIY